MPEKVRCPDCHSEDVYQGLDREYYTCAACGTDFGEGF